MAFRDYGESKNIKIPEEQEKIMDIMCEAWEQCLNRCDCVDNCPDRAGQNMRLAMCMALKQSRLLAEAGYAPAADVQEVKHAIWFRDPAKRNSWCCSRCGKFAMSDCHMWILTNYCPHCGAKMED